MSIGNDLHPGTVTISARLLRILLVEHTIALGIAVAAVVYLVRPYLGFPEQVTLVFLLAGLLIFPARVVRSDSLNVRRPSLWKWIASLVLIGAVIYFGTLFIYVPISR